MKFTCCAGIVTYEPDLARLEDNVRSIKTQVSEVIVVDNGSSNLSDILTRFENDSKIVVVRLEENYGIAYALNVASKQAAGRGYSHIVYLDQDSVAAADMVPTLRAHVHADVAIVAPQIIDRNHIKFGSAVNPDGRTFKVTSAARKGIITSGSLTSLAAYDAVGGFDDTFFIDYVDYDFNRRLLAEGYTLLRSGDTYLLHECGKASPTPLILPRRDEQGYWRMERFYRFGHSSSRCYYKARNRVLYTKKYKLCGGNQGFEGTRQIPLQVALTLIFEGDRFRKLRAFWRGYRDGLATQVSCFVPGSRS